MNKKETLPLIRYKSFIIRKFLQDRLGDFSQDGEFSFSGFEEFAKKIILAESFDEVDEISY